MVRVKVKILNIYPIGLSKLHKIIIAEIISAMVLRETSVAQL